MNKNSNKLHNINRIKLRNNPAKLAAWTTVNHLERDPQKTTAPEDAPAQ